MIITMLQWPNMIFHYSNFTASILKPFFLISSIGLFTYLGFRYLAVFSSYFFIMLGVCISYSVANEVVYNAFFLRVLYFISICAAFYRYPMLMRQYIKIGLFLSTLLGIQAIILTFLYISDVNINFNTVNFIDGGEKQFNVFAGFENDYNYFRPISYFTETNRLAYFLTPSLFISYYYFNTRKNIFFKIMFLIISFGVIITFSAFSFFAILLSVSFYMVVVKQMSLKYFLALPIFALLIVFIYSFNPEFFSLYIDKSGSISYRVLGIISKYEMIIANPYGAGELALAKELEVNPQANSTITLLYWGVVAGLQSVFLLIILILMWVYNLINVSKLNNNFLALLSCGMIANLMQQSFYGTYFEYYFLSMMAVVVVSLKIYKKSGSIWFMEKTSLT